MSMTNSARPDVVRDIVITIQPDGDDHFAAFYGNFQLCLSTDPFVDAARELLQLGAPGAATLWAWHPSRSRLIGTVAEAAKGYFKTEKIVVPFRRRARARSMAGSGGDVA